VAPPAFDRLLGQLRALIQKARQQALRAVDAVQVRTHWEVGRHIVEFEQGGADRAAYGARLLSQLAERLTTEYGKGFDASNLRYMRLFYQAFPKCDALRHELSWTHYRTLLRVEEPKAREWYMVEAATQNWSTRGLERQIGTGRGGAGRVPAGAAALPDFPLPDDGGGAAPGHPQCLAGWSSATPRHFSIFIKSGGSNCCTISTAGCRFRGPTLGVLIKAKRRPPRSS
jgi:uncharacterized protein DUF1016